MVSLPGDSASSERVVTTPYDHGEQRADDGDNDAVVGQETGHEEPLWTQTTRNDGPDRAAVGARGVYRGRLLRPGPRGARTICAGPGPLGLFRLGLPRPAALPPESCT